MRTGTWRKWLAAAAREPLFHFVVLGLVLWSSSEFIADRRGRHTIHISKADQEHLVTSYYRQFNQPPTPSQLQALIQRDIHDEIFVREGLALGLDRNDEIVRRRIIQKYQFLQENLVMPPPPTDALLERWYAENRARYIVPMRVTFTQIYFSPDRDGEQGARNRASQVLVKLRQLRVDRAPGLGDPFPGPADVSSLAADEAVRLFGESELSRTLFQVPLRTWSGPFRSGYGWHLVYVDSRQDAHVPALTAVREQVLRDYEDARRQDLNDAAFEALKRKYRIVIDPVK